MYVFIREGPPAEFDGCLSPSGYICQAPRILVDYQEYHFDYDASISATVVEVELYTKIRKCSNTICELYESGCITTNPVTSKVTIGPISPWNLVVP